MEEIKGKLNVFKFMGSYNAETGEWDNDIEDLEKGLDDFIFWLEDNGDCYIQTHQDWEYTPDGSFY